MTALILQFPWLGKPLSKDGGKTLIRRHREAIGLSNPARACLADSLIMDHADPAYAAPEHDPA